MFQLSQQLLSGAPPSYREPKDVHRLAATVTEPSTERNTQILSQAAAQRNMCQ